MRQPRPDRQVLGSEAEQRALDHLLAAGLRLLARNVRYPFGELDLVMRDGSDVVFVEVRYRSSDEYGGGVASVTHGKQRKVIRAAQAFLQRHPALANAPCRFDVVGVDDGDELQWFKAAFDLGSGW